MEDNKMNKNYNDMSKEELIAEAKRIEAELKKSKAERKNKQRESKEIKAEKPGYKWRWSDERLITLYNRDLELAQLIDRLLTQRRLIRSEIGFINNARSGGCERNCNYYSEFDEDLYLKELDDFGYIRGLKL